MNQTKFQETWNKVPVDYYQNGVKRNILQAIWHGQKTKHAKKIIKDLNFKNCLDVGCASGYMISKLSDSFPHAKYHGIDVYDKAIEYAKKNYPAIEFKVASADKMPYKSNTFDLIISYETIEHVENPAKCLKEIKRILKPKGKAILAMDSGNLVCRLGWIVWENTSGKVWKDAHLYPFRHRELENLIKKSGFNIEKKFFTHGSLEVVFILSK